MDKEISLSDLSISDLKHLQEFLLSSERDARGYNEERECLYINRRDIITAEIVRRYGEVITIIDKIHGK